MNPGFSTIEIEKLKQECLAEGKNYIEVEDELDLQESGEFKQIQFIGIHESKEVIFDAAIYTLRMWHESLLLEIAEEKVKKKFRNYKPLEERDEHEKGFEEADELLLDLMEELEEEEEVKVQEKLEFDLDFDFGIGLEVVLNVEEISEEVIEKFIEGFRNNTFQLDSKSYSFRHMEEE